jgi:MFS family permease
MSSFLILAIVASFRGATMGMSQPLMISIMAKSSGSRQGRAVALRTTTNRLITVVVPVAMGGLMEAFGIAMSFYITGAIVAAIMLPALWAMRRAGLAKG